MQTASRSYCETCPGKVERSNAYDWSSFHPKPERDQLVCEREITFSI